MKACLLSALKASEKENKRRTKKICEELKKLEHKFSKSQINEIRKNLYEIENEKILSAPKEIEEYLLELQKKLSKLKKYYDKDKYKGTRTIRNFFDLPIDEDCYKPIISDGVFNSKYVQHESIGGEGKDKNLSIEKYIDRIKPYLSDMINNHKAQEKNHEFIQVIK